MASFNKVILAGNMTRDPELRYTPKGMAIAKCTLAVNRKWRNEAGEDKEEVTFVDFQAFGRSAEVLGQYTKKGSGLLLEGRLRLDQWDDRQTGQKRSKLGIVAESFQFLGSPQGGDRPTQERRAAPTASAPGEDQGNPDGVDDDVPF